MNVLNRKMFANRDARRKLADMGGIIASSAELLGTAQKFAPGGRASTEEYLVIIPGITDTPVKLNADTLARLQELSPEAMSNATVLDRDTAAAQGMDIDRLRPGDLFIERRMMETIRPTIEAPAINVDEIVAREARITDDARQFAQDRRSFPQPLDRIVDPTGPVGIFTGKTPGEKAADVASLFRSKPETMEDRIADDARQFAQDRRSFPQPLDRIVDPTGPVGIFTGKTPGEKFMGPGIISGKTPGEKLAGVTSLFRSEPEPVSEPDLVSTTQGRGDDDMRVGFDPNRTITESLALSRGAADTVAPGSTTQDMALSQIMDRAENLTGQDKAAASLEALIATNQPGVDVAGLESVLLPPEQSTIPAGIGSLGRTSVGPNAAEIERMNEFLDVAGIGPATGYQSGPATDTTPSFADRFPGRDDIGSPQGALNYNELIQKAASGSPITETDLVASVEAGLLNDQQAADINAMVESPSYTPSAEEQRIAGLDPDLSFPEGPTNPDLIIPTVMDAVSDYGAGVFGGRTNEEQAAIDEARLQETETYNALTQGLKPDTAKTTAQETAEQAAETNEQAQADVSDRADVDPPLPAEEPIDAPSIVPAATNPDASPAERSNATATQVLSGLGVKDAANMSTKERVKAYQDMFKEFLGEDDADANEEKWHNLAMIGFAIAAGEDPNALSNIAGGLLQGSKLMQSQRAQKREREDKLTSMALEQVLSEDAAARKFERDLDLIRARGTGTGSAFEKMPTYTEAVLDELQSLRSMPTNIGKSNDELLEIARQTVLSLPAYSGNQTQPTVGTGGTGGLPTVTSQSEYDALPSGSEFIQNGQRRKKP